jgi:hypothetical protein
MTVNRLAIGFLTKDRVELSRQSVQPLLQPERLDLFWFDGSDTPEGRTLPVEVSLTQPPGHRIFIHSDVRGGPDAAVAYALTTMLKGTDYTHIGLVENDVLLPDNWLDSILALFDIGFHEGLAVGAASARCYEDRILIQRDGYAVMHNLGWGMQIMTREAARLALTHMRTGHTLENRRLFCQLTGMDIGKYWAFRGQDHMLCADWGNDRVLAALGLASLALTPSPVQMIGQTPPLAEQGLTIAGPDGVPGLLDDDRFALYRDRTACRRNETWLPASTHFLCQDNTYTIFPHQLLHLGASRIGDWRLKWAQGFGPFAWRAGGDDRTYWPYANEPVSLPTLSAQVSGPVEALVSGGDTGGQWVIEDTHSGYVAKPTLSSEAESGVVGLVVPSGVSYRPIRLTALTPGVVFYGLRVREPQPWDPTWRFDWNDLPPV